SLDPSAAYPHIDLGRIYLKGLRKPKEAIAEYRAALALDPNQASAHYALGIALATQGDNGNAQVELEKASALAPQSPLPLTAVGPIYAANGDFDKALGTLSNALTKAPKYVPAYLARGDVLFAKG